MRMRIVRLVCALIPLALGSVSIPARAGFEWKSPAPAAGAQTAPSPMQPVPQVPAAAFSQNPAFSAEGAALGMQAMVLMPVSIMPQFSGSQIPAQTQAPLAVPVPGPIQMPVQTQAPLQQQFSYATDPGTLPAHPMQHQAATAAASPMAVMPSAGPDTLSSLPPYSMSPMPPVVPSMGTGMPMPIPNQGYTQGYPIPSYQQLPAYPAASFGAPPSGYMPASRVSPQQPVPYSSSQGVVINPYPQQQRSQYSQTYPGGMTSAPANGPIEQAMMERSQILNPLRLGPFHGTGVQPESVPVAMPNINPNPLPVPPVDGAPLPGMVPYYPEDMMPETGGGERAGDQVSFSQALGFGKDLPLALALNQVIPDDFAYAFDPEVDAATIVSWEGGRPWNEVLQDMLAPVGLSSHIMRNRVMIKPQSNI